MKLKNFSASRRAMLAGISVLAALPSGAARKVLAQATSPTIVPPVKIITHYNPTDPKHLGKQIGKRDINIDFNQNYKGGGDIEDYTIEDMKHRVIVHARMEFLNTVANNFQSCYLGLLHKEQPPGSSPDILKWPLQIGARSGDPAGKPPKTYPVAATPKSVPWYRFDGYGDVSPEKTTHHLLYRGYWFPHDAPHITSVDHHIREGVCNSYEHGSFYELPIYNGNGQPGPAKKLYVVTLDLNETPDWP